MFIPKTSDELPDAPPAYEDAQAISGPAAWNSDEKSGYLPDVDTSSAFRTPALASSSSRSPQSSDSSSWFYGASFFGGSAVTNQVQETVLGLIKEIVKHPETAAPTYVLDSCAEACRTRGLSFSSLLQQPLLEGHTPIYWAIIKRPPQYPQLNDDTLIMALIEHAAPLKPTTVSDVRLACLQNADPVIFQKLRCMPAFAPLSGPEEMLMGHPDRRDRIEVQELPGADGAFTVRFSIPMFQRRMKIASEIQLEFIARSRLWLLEFFVAKPHREKRLHESAGTWGVALSLLENSSPSWVDSRLEILEVTPSTSDHSSSAPAIAISVSENTEEAKESKNIVLPLKTKSRQLAAPQREYLSASLEELMNSFQYTGGVFVNADESMDVQMEVKLVKAV